MACEGYYNTPKYPKSIAFIVSNEFCERFNFYGMRTILVLYMTIKLGYSDNTATVLFHIFTSLVYFFPVMGAVIADSFLGKFRTILYLSCVYAIGSWLITLGAIPTLNLPAQTMTVIGLLLIGLGSGGIKPCVAAFGGDQFKIPEQAKQLATFFSLFYFSINAGSLISTYLMPILRNDVHCFGELSCFSLAFGVPGVLMVISIIIFVCGKSLYIVKKPTGNVIVDVTKCIFHAISEKSKQKHRDEAHWLDYAEPKYTKQMINDIKSVLKILLLFLPLPIFWALFDQQGSRWTFQATRMNGDIGFIEIKPDQMQLINPLLILVFIPLFDVIVYPLLASFGIKRPLQKLTVGGLLAAIAFIISGFVEIQLEKTYPSYPSIHESQMRVFNGIPCIFEMQNFSGTSSENRLEPFNVFKYTQVVDERSQKLTVLATNTPGCSSYSEKLNIQAGKSNSFFITGIANNLTIKSFNDKIDKSKSGNPYVRVLANLNSIKVIKFIDKNGENVKTIGSDYIDQFEILPGIFTVYADDVKISNIEVQLGGVYTIVISQTKDNINLKLHEITSPNTVHMLWLIPQYVIMTGAEVMFSVTGLKFAYSQAPASMKSLLQASWLLTVAFGNVFVVIIAEAKFFQSQAHEFFLFSVMMFIDMVIFVLLAMKYKYVNTNNSKRDDDAENGIQIEENKKKTFTNNAFQDD
ncbi:hypothetical protein PVAND_013630 [Polypedilum vanderplanki]|uniref:Oligopeptide transporter 1 n=1 Tax=Polypedilum vanderplanki TaxID=319348 RepID=A0A9J6CS66_POLVA|nr:hypothetical protein PVAND_013630 [Polypedilum vanderplanki]